MLNNVYVCINREDFSYYDELLQEFLIEKYKERNLHLMNIHTWEHYNRSQNLFQRLIEYITLRYINNPLYQKFCNSQLWLEQFDENYYNDLGKIFTHNCSNVYISLDLYYKLKDMEDEESAY